MLIELKSCTCTFNLAIAYTDYHDTNVWLSHPSRFQMVDDDDTDRSPWYMTELEQSCTQICAGTGARRLPGKQGKAQTVFYGNKIQPQQNKLG